MMTLQVRPAPHAAVDHVRQTLAMGHLTNQMPPLLTSRLIERPKDLHPTQHKIGDFGDDLYNSQPLSWLVWTIKLKITDARTQYTQNMYADTPQINTKL